MKNYVCTYADGTEYKLMARNARDAVLAATELYKARVIRVFPEGDWIHE